MKRLLALAVLILLAGCTPAPAAAPTPSPAPASSTPTPESATPQQFASIIAGQESDWRATIEDAGDCRFLWTMGPSNQSEKTEAMTCYLRESTIVLSAGTAAKDIRALTPSSDMQALVSDTLDALDAIAAVDLESICGDAFDGPRQSKKCDATLGTLYGNYNDLGRVLDKWKPYL